MEFIFIILVLLGIFFFCKRQGYFKECFLNKTVLSDLIGGERMSFRVSKD